MNECDCPHTEKIGAMQAQILTLKEKLAAIEKTARESADELIENKAADRVRNLWIDRTARFIGYAFIIGLFMAAGKATGLAEIILKMLRL